MDAFFVLLILSFSISSGLNEKKATSEPDIRAEMKSNMTRTINPIASLKSRGLTTMPGKGITDENKNPGSNCSVFSKTR
jgi:hypothetical protein